ncbi:MAG TPA: hypothetical protein VJ986_06840 [Gaiellaceae bacterium]|nr:hypothetical protein [Gaiellaceae bacterium]
MEQRPSPSRSGAGDGGRVRHFHEGLRWLPAAGGTVVHAETATFRGG